MSTQQQPYQQPYQQGAGAPVAAGGSGPIGTPTNKTTQILLTIVTFGIWAILWSYKQFKEMNEYSGEGLGATTGLIIAIFVGIAVPFLINKEVEENLYGRDGRPSPVNVAGGVIALIPFVGGLLWYMKTQDAINEFWVSKGAQPAG